MTPVILSGGSGTRLWPVSRASYPKQFCDFYDRSFLRETLERVKDFEAAYIVTVESMKN
ncbi:MAG: mannose-1-phosphate guanylyltransferase/mannose-6-phosphate isomerase, partial [Bdellovibrionales bacterium]|nr:mannose-1-phosphate guanylyltransferase/mannose-6-phosphate isomerase [Bdellovibrionales bacterium]